MFGSFSGSLLRPARGDSFARLLSGDMCFFNNRVALLGERASMSYAVLAIANYRETGSKDTYNHQY